METNFLTVVENKTNSIEENNFKTGFGGLSKINKIKNLGFPSIDKQDIQNWIDDIEDNQKLTIDELKKINNLDCSTKTALLKNNVIIQSNISMGYYSPKIDKNKYEIIKEKNMVATTLKQNGLEIKQLSIISTDVEEYNKIPPAHIIMLEQKARELKVFDKLVVLEPKEEEATKKIIKDPVLAGICNEYPNKFFIIGVWNDNIPLNYYLEKGNKSLVEETNKFLSEFKEIGSLGLGLLNKINLLENGKN